MISVFVAIPSTGSWVDGLFYQLKAIEKKYEGQIQFVYPEICVRRVFHDFARNALVDEFMKSTCDVLWFIDSDVTPNLDVPDLITKHYDEWLVAGAPYPVFMTPAGYDGPQIVYTVYEKVGDKIAVKPDVRMEGTALVDGIATGCLLIKREVFLKHLPEKPYFEFKFDPETRMMTEGEDLGFVRRCSEKGIKFFIDFSLVCRHQKSADLLDLNNYAISYAQNSLLAYQRAVRAEIQRKMGAGSQVKSQIILPNGRGSPRVG